MQQNIPFKKRVYSRELKGPTLTPIQFLFLRKNRVFKCKVEGNIQRKGKRKKQYKAACMSVFLFFLIYSEHL